MRILLFPTCAVWQMPVFTWCVDVLFLLVTIVTSCTHIDFDFCEQSGTFSCGLKTRSFVLDASRCVCFGLAVFWIAEVLAGWGIGIANVLQCFLHVVVVACCDRHGLRCFCGVRGSRIICVFVGCRVGLVCWCAVRALLFFCFDS